MKTRRRIVDAAVGLIKDKGIENTTMVEICSAVGVAQGTFYHYFSSINDILIEILRIEGNELLEHLKSLETEDPGRKLTSLMEFQLDYYEKKGKGVVAQIYRNEFEPYSGESRIEEQLPIRACLAEVIAEGQATGVFSDDQNAERCAFSITSLLFLYSLLWIRDPSDTPLKEMAWEHISEEIERLVVSRY